MKIENFIFDEDTNYQDVQDEIWRGLSYIVGLESPCSGDCNECDGCESICQIFKFLRTAQIDQDLGNTIRYERNIQSAYNIIYAIFNN